MRTFYGHPEIKFLKLTLNTIIETEAAIKQLENEGLNKLNYNLWHLYKKDLNTYKKDLNKTVLNGFVPVYIDNSGGNIDLIKYCNNGLSYGARLEENKIVYYLCESPILSASVNKIISRHENLQELKEAFYTEKQNIF